MFADPLVIRWESLLVAAGLLALAIWALRVPVSAQPEPQVSSGAALQVTRVGQPSQVIELRDGAILGRGRECDVVFDDATVSKSHARLHLDGGTATIEDLDSTNGTLLNGARISGTAALRRGDRIDLGTNQIVYLGAPSRDDA